MRRNFIVAYAKLFVNSLQLVAQDNCPWDCNYIEGRRYVYKAEVANGSLNSNYLSMAAYELWEWDAHVFIEPCDVIALYETDSGDFCDLCEIYGDPFRCVRTLWKDDFMMCLHEIMH